jgi:hypothetical protein
MGKAGCLDLAKAFASLRRVDKSYAHTALTRKKIGSNLAQEEYERAVLGIITGGDYGVVPLTLWRSVIVGYRGPAGKPKEGCGLPFTLSNFLEIAFIGNVSTPRLAREREWKSLSTRVLHLGRLDDALRNPKAKEIEQRKATILHLSTY